MIVLTGMPTPATQHGGNTILALALNRKLQE